MDITNTTVGKDEGKVAENTTKGIPIRTYFGVENLLKLGLGESVMQ